MAVSANVFNPNQSAIQLSVNNGSQMNVPGTSAAQNWQPQTSPISFQYGPPSPGTLGLGDNMLMVSTAGREPTMLRVYISQQIPISSLQFYIFLGEQLVWTLLNSGQGIAYGTT